ncbi:MAG: lamin tail domain-containing protein [Tannerellaceae bacterium]|jgi:hypothetical protein|nr:lamin tail domain-containing protein [Tannerellaceae bacterium]
MKRVLLACALLLPFHLFSQFNESFSGIEITSDNPWEGDLDEFGINASGQLQFVSPSGKAGSASIHIPLPFEETMTWEMDMKLNFQSTDLNNLRIYVYEDGADSIYIQAGNNSRRVSLYEKNGNLSAKPRIANRKELLKEPYPFVSIRLTLEEGKVWTLYTRADNEEEFYMEGSYTMPSPPDIPRAVMILTCRYIKGRISEYLIDNIKVTTAASTIPDPDPKPDPDPEPEEYYMPELLSVEILNDDELQFNFDKPVDISDAVCKIDNAGEATLSYGSTMATVNVCFPEAMEDGRKYLVSINGWGDLNGRRIPGITWEILYEKSGGEEEDTPPAVVPGIPGQIRISEVMADTKGLVALPETEYVELHNTSDIDVSLEGWAFVYDGRKTTIDALSMPAGEYAVLYRAGNPIHVDGTGIAVGLAKFPAALANGGKLLQLEDATGAQMDEFHYPKARPGISWERSGDDIYLSTDARGGTPGSGSTNDDKTNEDDNTTGISAPKLREDGLYSIDYLLEGYDYRCRIYIYNIAGMKVAEIANHELPGLSGELLWDGKSSSGIRLKTGVYILSAELYNTNGNKKHYRKVFVVR